MGASYTLRATYPRSFTSSIPKTMPIAGNTTPWNRKRLPYKQTRRKFKMLTYWAKKEESTVGILHEAV